MAGPMDAPRTSFALGPLQITLRRRIGHTLVAAVAGGRATTLAIDGGLPVSIPGARTLIPFAVWCVAFGGMCSVYFVVH